MIIYYKNSFLASLVSITGCVLILAAIATFVDDAFVAIVAGIIGVVCLWGAKQISRNKSFKKWWKQIEDKNLEPEIARSAQLALEIYKKNPDKRTLKKLAQLNPQAAAAIQQSIAKKK